MKSLFRSYKVTLAMNVPFAATLVAVNENLKVILKPTESSYTFSIYFACAWLAGSVAAVLTNPLDVTKTRLQTQNMEMSCLRENNLCKPECLEEKQAKIHYKDFMSTVNQIYKNEGYAGFTKGTMARMIMIAPSAAISWGTYEFFKSILSPTK